MLENRKRVLLTASDCTSPRNGVTHWRSVRGSVFYWNHDILLAYISTALSCFQVYGDGAHHILSVKHWFPPPPPGLLRYYWAGYLNSKATILCSRGYPSDVASQSVGPVCDVFQSREMQPALHLPSFVSWVIFLLSVWRPLILRDPKLQDYSAYV
jgi:hypothetical protein